MPFFHDYTLSWWQAGMLKLALFAFGIIIGAAWPVFWKKKGMWSLLWIVALVFMVYLMVALWPQFFSTK